MNKRILSVIGLVSLGLLLFWGSTAYAQSRWTATDWSPRGMMGNYWNGQNPGPGMMGGGMMNGGRMGNGMDMPNMHGKWDGLADEVVEIPADAQEWTVVGTEFAFEPTEFTVKAGHPVALTFINEGAIEHDWVLFAADGQEVEDAHVHVRAGETRVAVFTLEPGTYEVKCTIPGHYEAGMKGQVVAES